MMMEFWIFHNLLSPYYSRANGQAKSTNKVLMSVIHKILESKKQTRKKSCLLYCGRIVQHTRLQWDTPLQLMYGPKAFCAIWINVIESEDSGREQTWWHRDTEGTVIPIQQTGQQRVLTQWATEVMQKRRKYWHDKHLCWMKFQPG